VANSQGERATKMFTLKQSKRVFFFFDSTTTKNAPFQNNWKDEKKKAKLTELAEFSIPAF
jgi:hypothetical protein